MRDSAGHNLVAATNLPAQDKAFKWPLATVVIGAVVFRFFFFLYALRHVLPSSDESWPSLMAMHMLKGEFPIVYWGQSYMGTQESAFQAILIALFGPHTAVVRIYPLLFGFLFLWFTYLLAVRTYNRDVGLIALTLLAIPVPYLTNCSVIISPDNYLALTALGSLSLVILHGLVYGPTEKATWKKYAALGFLLGFTFWLHILVIGYMAVAGLFLFLRDKLIFFRRKFWAFVPAFIVGSLPLIIYNIRERLATFRDVGKTSTWQHAWILLQTLFAKTLHFLIGTKLMFAGDSPYSVSLPAPLAVVLGLIWIFVLSLVIAVRFKSLLPLARLSLKGTDGTAILVVMAAVAMLVFCRSSRSSSVNVRYVLPILSVLPVLFAYGLWRIGQKSRLMAGIMLATVLAAQGWGNVLLARGWADPRVINDELHLPQTGGLLKFLEDRGIRHAYAHFWVSYRLTFESGEKLICAEPFNIRFSMRAADVKFLDEVRRADPVAYVAERLLGICRGVSVKKFDEMLGGIGGSYRKEVVAPFTVFYDFVPPYGTGPLKEIPRDSWQPAASSNSNLVFRAMDGDPGTCWSSAAPQEPGTFFEVDLGSTQALCKIGFDVGKWVRDIPRGYRVETSLEGQHWKKVFEPRFCVCSRVSGKVTGITITLSRDCEDNFQLHCS